MLSRKCIQSLTNSFKLLHEMCIRDREILASTIEDYNKKEESQENTSNPIVENESQIAEQDSVILQSSICNRLC